MSKTISIATPVSQRDRVMDETISFVFQSSNDHDIPHTCRKEFDYPLWQDMPAGSPQRLFVFMAWTAQARTYPSAFCDCKFPDEQAKLELWQTIEYMLRVALTAAGVESKWDELFDATGNQEVWAAMLADAMAKVAEEGRGEFL